jgi:hypothetical protein
MSPFCADIYLPPSMLLTILRFCAHFNLIVDESSERIRALSCCNLFFLFLLFSGTPQPTVLCCSFRYRSGIILTCMNARETTQILHSLPCANNEGTAKKRKNTHFFMAAINSRFQYAHFYSLPHSLAHFGLMVAAFYITLRALSLCFIQ